MSAVSVFGGPVGSVHKVYLFFLVMIVSDADDFHNPFTTTIDIHSFHFLHLHRSATGRCMERLHIYNTYNTYFIYFECSWRLGDNLRRVLADFCCLVWKEGPSMFIQGIDRHLQY